MSGELDDHGGDDAVAADDADPGATGLGARLDALADWQLVTLFMLGTYLLWFLAGFALDFGVRGQINAIANLTFYVALFGMLALALNLHWGYTGLFNIGIVAFMGIGMYTFAVLVNTPLPAGSRQGFGGFGLPVPVALVGAAVVSAVFGLVVALPALRLRADYLAIVTIAFSEIVRFSVLSRQLQEFTLFGVATGLGGGQGIDLRVPGPQEWLLSVLGLTGAYADLTAWFGATTGIEQAPRAVLDNLLYAALLLGVMVAYYVLLKRTGESPFGRVLKAIRGDEDVARALGKNTGRFKTVSFMVGCALMGLVGVLWWYDVGSVTPTNLRPRLTFYVWIALIIGGAGSNTGSVLGGATFAALLFQGPRYFKNLVRTAVDPESTPTNFAAAVEPLSGLDPLPFLLYTVDNMQTLQLVLMGVVLVWLMQNRQDGLLGHRSEEAAAVDLSAPARTDGGDPDE